MIILHIDIAISKTNMIISEIDNGHVYDLAPACTTVESFSGLQSKGWFPTLPAKIKLVFKWLTVRNTLTSHDTDLITAIKSLYGTIL